MTQQLSYSTLMTEHFAITVIVYERSREVMLTPHPRKEPGRPSVTAHMAKMIDQIRARRCSWQRIAI